MILEKKDRWRSKWFCLARPHGDRNHYHNYGYITRLNTGFPRIIYYSGLPEPQSVTGGCQFGVSIGSLRLSIGLVPGKLDIYYSLRSASLRTLFLEPSFRRALLGRSANHHLWMYRQIVTVRLTRRNDLHESSCMILHEVVRSHCAKLWESLFPSARNIKPSAYP